MKLDSKKLGSDVYMALKDTNLRDVSAKIDVSIATISRIRHEGMPDLLTYAKICKWLKKDLKTYIKN